MNVSITTYQNDRMSLIINNFTIISTVDEYLVEKKIKFKCSNDHVTELTRTSFKNKYSKDPKTLCSECVEILKRDKRFNPLITSAFYPILYIKLYKAYIK